jgi:glycosyltransferase involved in cell wall biosynthesis
MPEVSDPASLKVVAIAPAFVVPSNRARWERLAELHSDVHVTLVTRDELTTTRYGEKQVFRVVPEERANFRLIPLRTTGRHGFYRSVPALIRRTRPDVVHVFEEPTEWMLLQFFVASRTFAPHAVRLFYYYTNILNRPTRWDRRLKQAAIFRLAQGVFVGSMGAEQVVRALGYRGNSQLQTALGADERVWTPDQSTSERPFTIGFVGSLVLEKGVTDLARAAVGLGGKWRLVMVGDGAARTEVEAIFQNAGLSDRLEMRGLVERDQLPEVVRGMDVLVLPSRTVFPHWREQFGLVLAEAMLSGVAVIGSDSGAIPEVIEHTGLIFPEGNPEALRTHLARLRDYPSLRRELAHAGRERALTWYSASALADETYTLYSALVAERRGVARPPP